MRTLLHQFAEEFAHTLTPLVDSQARFAGLLRSRHDDLVGIDLRMGMTSLTRRLAELQEVVARQKAYVLILGPLKSGKSTLMNALSASYVSEVSSLPAYPCLVFVDHGRERRYAVTRYDGTEEVYTDPGMLHVHMQCAHADLAERICEVELRQEAFDPEQHFPRAIRRIDVELPADDLGRAGAVLVDTPGLYSRMKFDYDRMTRDFRRTAACAVFIVKSENLFLEQVFDEFDELLGLFGRIFLVINLDSSKQDLGPDGSLVPSAEQRDPDLIIRAFQNLAMNARLKQAEAEGRLQIYAVDLQKAARARIAEARGRAAVDPGQEAYPGEDQLTAFMSDLTGHLNSTDYVEEFVSDKLRSATALAHEAIEQAARPAAADLREKVAALERANATNGRRLQAIFQARSSDWPRLFEEMAEELGEAMRQRARELDVKYGDNLARAVDRWFESDGSLRKLIAGACDPILAGFRNELALFVANWLGERVSIGTAGVRVPFDLANNLGLAEVDLRSIGRECLQSLRCDELMPELGAPFDAEDVEVRKAPGDWFALRGRSKIRRNLFGPASDPARRLDPTVKAARLGRRGRSSILGAIASHLGRWVEDSVEQMRAGLLRDYARTTRSRIEARLQEMGNRWTERQEEIRAAMEDYGALAEALGRMRDDAESVERDLEALWARTCSREADFVLRPARAPSAEAPDPHGLSSASARG